MKTNLSLPQFLAIILLLALSSAPCALSQIPQGFNYQAVALDAVSGNPVTDPIDVSIAILSDDSPETVIWEEIHYGVDPDDHGLFNIVVGQGVYESGPVPNFSDIDWTEPPLYIRTMIYYGGSWKNMGSAQLWSVPYAMVADSLGGPLKKLEVEGETEDMEESLFEVRNKDGHIVFAVYNEGVRINVSDGDVKGPKGGFAIGGFGMVKQEDDHQYFFVSGDSIRAYIDSTSVKGPKGGFAIGGFEYTKGKSQDYMKVTRDSVRIYLDANPATKGPKGGFAIGGFDYTKGDQNFFNVSMDTLGKVYPSENRILWYPLKNAFRTGKVLIEKRDSVGENSFASGYESKAVGKYSQGLGYKAVARGDYSTAIGKNAVAEDINSFAFGEDAIAKNDESYAIGRGAVASGYRSFAFGSAGLDEYGNPTDVVKALGDYAFSFGQGSLANGNGSVSIGISNSAGGHYSFTTGYKSHSDGLMSIAIGYNTIATGNYSMAFGDNSKADGTNSVAIGSTCRANKYNSVAIGTWAEAYGTYSTALGYRTTANGDGSFAVGYYSVAEGVGSKSIGEQTKASSYSETVMGSFNSIYTPLSKNNWNDLDRLFVIGNGHDYIESNAVTVLKSGRVGLQTVLTPTYALELPNSSTIGIGQARAYAWATYSDSRAKSDQTELRYGLEELMLLMPSEYFHHSTANDNNGIKIQDEGKHDIGLIAQEVYDVIPEAVNKPLNEEKELWSISYDKLVPVMVNAIKEQQHQIESQQLQIEELKAIVQELLVK